MDLVLDCLIVVAFIAGLQLISWALERGVIGRAFRVLRVRLSRKLPAGFYRIEEPVGIGFGNEDTTLVLRVPVRTQAAGKPVRYLAVTDANTEFSVNREPATPDALLEAYDDELGPLELQVNEPGRVAEIGIAAEKPRQT